MAFAAILLLFSICAWVAIINPRAALLVTIFLLPFSGVDVDVGLRVTAYQVSLAALAGVTFVRLTQPGLRPTRIAGGLLFSGFVLYTVIWSLLQIGFLPQVEVITVGLRGPVMRAFVQIFQFLFSLTPVILVPMIIKRREDIVHLALTFIASVVLLTAIGWVQIAGWYATGNNPIPIGMVGNALGGSYAAARSGAFALDALNIYRMNSFAGEPRDLGIWIITAMIFVQAWALTAQRPRGLLLAALWLFLFISMLLTFSTSAIGVWLIASAALIPACLVFRIRIERRTSTLLGAAAAFIVPFMLLIAGLEAYGVPVINILAERTVERLSSDGAIEDFDLAILGYLKVAPASAITGVGLGNIHLYATPYLDPLYALYAEGNVFVAKTQYLRFISEIGFIGLALFLGWYLQLTILTRRAIAGIPELAPLIPAVSAILVICMGTFQAIPIGYIIAGAMTALCAMADPARASQRGPVAKAPRHGQPPRALPA
jgi:hypothetical protein